MHYEMSILLSEVEKAALRNMQGRYVDHLIFDEYGSDSISSYDVSFTIISPGYLLELKNKEIIGDDNEEYPSFHANIVKHFTPNSEVIELTTIPVQEKLQTIKVIKDVTEWHNPWHSWRVTAETGVLLFFENKHCAIIAGDSLAETVTFSMFVGEMPDQKVLDDYWLFRINDNMKIHRTILTL